MRGEFASNYSVHILCSLVFGTNRAISEKVNNFFNEARNENQRLTNERAKLEPVSKALDDLRDVLGSNKDDGTSIGA